MVINPIEIDRAVLWGIVFAIIIVIMILLAFADLYMWHRIFKEDLYRDWFIKRWKNRKSKESWEQSGEDDS